MLPSGREGCATATNLFIQDSLQDLLAKYRRLGRDRIAALALAGEFRHTARIVRNRMRDHVRKTYRELRARNRAEPEPPSLEPTRLAMELAAAHIQDQWATFVRAIGNRCYWTLRIVASVWPLGSTKRERKGQIVSAIAGARGISLQHARADRRALLRAVEESNDPTVIALGTAGWFSFAFRGV